MTAAVGDLRPVEVTGRHIGQRRCLTVVCVILFLTFVDNTIVSVVLSDVQGALGAGVTDLQWIIDGYMLTFAALMLTGGTLGDILGRKAVMLTGVAIFCAGSAVAMCAPDSKVLIIGRVVMGVGAAASEPGTLSMIRHIFPDRQDRATALGAWAAVSGVALALGPMIGGAISGSSDWREIFAFGVVVGLGAFVAGAVVLPENRDPQGRHLDLFGLLLGAGCVASITAAVIEGEASGYGAPGIDALFGVSVVTGVAFFLWERRTEDPVLRLELFRNPTYTAANVVAFVTNFGVFAIFFFTVLYLQIIGNFSDYQIAVTFLTMAAAMGVVAPLTGRWVAARGPAAPTVVGCLVSGAGIIVVDALLKPGVATVTLAWSLGVVGLGFGMTLVTMTSSVLTIVRPERSGEAASTVNTSRELGGVIGVAVLGAIVNSRLTSQLAEQLTRLGLPANIRTLVINAVTHGGTLNGPQASAAAKTNPKLVQEVLDAAYRAFGNGLDIALLIAGALLLAVGLYSAVAMRASHAEPESDLATRRLRRRF